MLGDGRGPAGDDGERGSATLLVAALAAAILAVGAAAVTVSGAYLAGGRATAAADAAALAAADTASGYVSGYPCTTAGEAARLGGVTLAECTVEDGIAVVAVQYRYLGFVSTVRSRAGPPEAGTGAAKLSEDPQD